MRDTRDTIVTAKVRGLYKNRASSILQTVTLTTYIYLSIMLEIPEDIDPRRDSRQVEPWWYTTDDYKAVHRIVLIGDEVHLCLEMTSSFS